MTNIRGHVYQRGQDTRWIAAIVVDGIHRSTQLERTWQQAMNVVHNLLIEIKSGDLKWKNEDLKWQDLDAPPHSSPTNIVHHE